MFLTGSEGFQKFARGAFYVFFALFPFLIYRGFLFNGSSTRAMNLILLVEILAVCLGFALFKKNVRASMPRSPITLAALGLFVIMIISSLMGVDVATSFWSKVTRTTGLYYFIHLGAFFCMLVIMFERSEKLRKLLSVFSVSTALFSLASLLAKDGLKIIFAQREWQGFTIGNSTFAGAYLFAGFVVSAYLAYTTQKAERRWWHYVLPVVTIMNPYLLGLFREGFIGSAQSSSIALFASIIMLLGAFGISKIPSLMIRRAAIWSSAGLGLVVGVFAVYSFLTPGGFIQKEYLKDATAARPIVWELSRAAIKERPAFGWGLDNFDRAYQAHYDNRVMEQANGGEAWFDRAHNVFIDQAVETGYAGLAAYLLVFLTVIGCMLYVIFRSREWGDQALAVFIIVYLIGHLMELQTAFDTTISYVPLALVGACGVLVLHRTRVALVGTEQSVWKLSNGFKYLKAAVLVAGFVTLFFIGTFPILRAQIANGSVRTAGSSDKRLPIYPILFSSPVDTAGFLNRTTTDLERGISLTPQLLQKPDRVTGFIKELDILAAGHEAYVAEHPEDYRARNRLVEIYIYGTLFGQDNLEKAHTHADILVSLAPNLPQAYWEHAVAYLYQRKFDLAREWAKKALDLNPQIEESRHVVDYIERSIKTFPEIDLFNFIML